LKSLGVAAAFAFGADGVWIGTRFLATIEVSFFFLFFFFCFFSFS